MPKMKSTPSAKKRFIVHGSGGIKRSKAFKSHILTKKSTKVKRNFRGTTQINDSTKLAVTKMFPYS